MAASLHTTDRSRSPESTRHIPKLKRSSSSLLHLLPSRKSLTTCLAPNIIRGKSAQLAVEALSGDVKPGTLTLDPPSTPTLGKGPKCSLSYSKGPVQHGFAGMDTVGPNLRHLDLSRTAKLESGGRDKFNQALTASLAKCPALRTLKLCGNGMKDSGLEVLIGCLDPAGPKPAPSLEELDLSWNRFTNGNLVARLLVTCGQRLKNVSLEANELTDVAVVALSAGLSMNLKVQHLNLAKNAVGDVGVVALANALKHQCPAEEDEALDPLLLTPTARTPTARTPTARTPTARPSLARWLVSMQCALENGTAPPLLGSELGLRHLDLSNTKVADTGALALAESLRSPTSSLAVLAIHGTKIGESGWSRLEEVIRERHEEVAKFAEVASLSLNRRGLSALGKMPRPLVVQGLGLEALTSELATQAGNWIEVLETAMTNPKTFGRGPKDDSEEDSEGFSTDSGGTTSTGTRGTGGGASQNLDHSSSDDDGGRSDTIIKKKSSDGEKEVPKAPTLDKTISTMSTHARTSSVVSEPFDEPESEASMAGSPNPEAGLLSEPDYPDEPDADLEAVSPAPLARRDHFERKGEVAELQSRRIVQQQRARLEEGSFFTAVPSPGSPEPEMEMEVESVMCSRVHSRRPSVGGDVHLLQEQHNAELQDVIAREYGATQGTVSDKLALEPDAFVRGFAAVPQGAVAEKLAPEKDGVASELGAVQAKVAKDGVARNLGAVFNTPASDKDAAAVVLPHDVSLDVCPDASQVRGSGHALGARPQGARPCGRGLPPPISTAVEDRSAPLTPGSVQSAPLTPMSVGGDHKVRSATGKVAGKGRCGRGLPAPLASLDMEDSMPSTPNVHTPEMMMGRKISERELHAVRDAISRTTDVELQQRREDFMRRAASGEQRIAAHQDAIHGTSAANAIHGTTSTGPNPQVLATTLALPRLTLPRAAAFTAAPDCPTSTKNSARFRTEPAQPTVSDEDEAPAASLARDRSVPSLQPTAADLPVPPMAPTPAPRVFRHRRVNSLPLGAPPSPLAPLDGGLPLGACPSPLSRFAHQAAGVGLALAAANAASSSSIPVPTVEEEDDGLCRQLLSLHKAAKGGDLSSAQLQRVGGLCHELLSGECVQEEAPRAKAAGKGCPPGRAPPPKSGGAAVPPAKAGPPSKGKGKGKSAPPPPPPRNTTAGNSNVDNKSTEGADPADAPAKGKGKGKGPPPPPPAAAATKGAGKGKGAQKGEAPPPKGKGKGKTGAPPPKAASAPGPKAGQPRLVRAATDAALPGSAPFHRKIHWKPLELQDMDGTIFDSGSATHIDTCALQRMFEGESAKLAAAAAKSSSLLKTVQGRAEGTKVLSDTRARNVAIILKRLPASTSLLSRILCSLEWENELLRTDQLEQILDAIPTKEEAEQLKPHSGPEASAKLRDVEQLVLPLTEIRRGAARVKLICCARNASAQVESACGPLHTLREACAAIHSSQMLRVVMLSAIEIGNYINYGDSNKGAKAITIGSLLQLRDFKIGRMSSLHFLCAQLRLAGAREDASEALQRELRPVVEAAKYQIQGISQVVHSFESEAHMVAGECKNFAQEYQGEPGDEVVPEDVPSAAMDIRGSSRQRLFQLQRIVEQRLKVVKADVEATATEVQETLRFCGLKATSNAGVVPQDFEPFLTQLAEFVSAFSKHWSDVNADLPRYSVFFHVTGEGQSPPAPGDLSA